MQINLLCGMNPAGFSVQNQYIYWWHCDRPYCLMTL